MGVVLCSTPERVRSAEVRARSGRLVSEGGGEGGLVDSGHLISV